MLPGHAATESAWNIDADNPEMSRKTYHTLPSMGSVGRGTHLRPLLQLKYSSVVVVSDARLRHLRPVTEHRQRSDVSTGDALAMQLENPKLPGANTGAAGRRKCRSACRAERGRGMLGTLPAAAGRCTMRRVATHRRRA